MMKTQKNVNRHSVEKAANLIFLNFKYHFHETKYYFKLIKSTKETKAAAQIHLFQRASHVCVVKTKKIKLHVLLTKPPEASVCGLAVCLNVPLLVAFCCCVILKLTSPLPRPVCVFVCVISVRS